jgi:hypothetical protein
VDNASRFPAAGSKRRLLEAGTVPVLAQLPDVSSELPAARTLKKTTAQEVGYRFDPPQMAERGSSNSANDRASQFRTLKSELVYAPGNTRSLRPHVFDKARVSQRRRPAPRRESPILPRSNSFAIPRRGLLDSIAPVFRFAMLVALFTAAGTWVQVAFVKNQATPEQLETAKASVQRPAAGAGKTVNRPTQAPTALGPVGTTPESGTRVGRVREKDDFATLRGDIMPVEPATGNIGSSSPELIGPGLPHLQTTEPPQVVLGDHAGQQDDPDRPAEVARVPGFSIKIPSR